MNKVYYMQEHPGAAPYVFPGLVAVLGLFAIGYYYFLEGSMTAIFLEKGLIPGVAALVFALVLLLVMKRKTNKVTSEFKELREKGQLVEGTISEIVTHTTYTHHKGHSTPHYTYRFKVTYLDPISRVEKTVDSVETHTQYILQGSRCTALLFQDKLLVEEAEVEANVAAEQEKKKISIILLLIFVAIVWLVTKQLN